MALSYSQTVNHARLDSIDLSIGASALLRIYSGSAPAIGAAATGSQLVEMALPATYFGAASAGTLAKAGTWSGTGAIAGTAGYFRIVPAGAAAAAVGSIQGTISAPAGGGDMILDNTSIAVSQVVTVNSFTITAANT